MWFAGNHSDIGGSYPENEARLSDIALDWMVKWATVVPAGLKHDDRVLKLSPYPEGMQHDEVRTGFGLIGDDFYGCHCWFLNEWRRKRWRHPRLQGRVMIFCPV